MRSRVHSNISGRELMRRGPLQLAPEQCGQYRDLRQLGIGLDAVVANDAALVGPALGSLGGPFWKLQNWLPGVVRQITQVRLIDELIGVMAVGAWEDAEVVQTTSELAALPELYGDHTNIPLANYRFGYERREIVRFEQGFMISKLEEARASKFDFNDEAEKRAAVALAMDIIRNRVGFNGYNAPETRIYGFLNDPNLPAYTTLPNGAGGSSSWASKTFLEICADIRKMMIELEVGSGGNIRTETDAVTMAIPLGHSQYLGLVDATGVTSVRDWARRTYPNLRFVSAPELIAANGGANVIYVYADRVPADDSTDDGSVIVQMVPARFQALGVEVRAKGRVEDFTNALGGVLIKRPWAIKRYSGV
ncbi:major capsid family protein [Azorhizophilus paspali]|uniref:Major capsid family protein n=1 Tax=Azorhizophilus paspali TaxID=69963 RepID=A0ABV6SHL6_AZOPA